MPPDTYANILSSKPGDTEAALVRMQRDWDRIVQVEQRRLALASAMELTTDLALTAPIRLLYALFERDGFSAQSFAGRRLLRGLRPPQQLSGAAFRSPSRLGMVWFGRSSKSRL